ncbi:MAG: translocation/assembly module TamB domain-containing protein [Tannerellaceae bacterium]
MLAFFWIFYAVPAILLQVPYLQRKISTIATIELSNRLGVPVKIGKVDIEWFNRLVLENLYLEDQNGVPLFEATHVAAGFEVLPLLDGKFVFTTVRLFGFSVNLKKKTPDAPLNLQFVLDAFASKDTTKESPNIDLRFNSILIKRGNFNYDVQSEAFTPGRFNPKHINIKNLSAKISMKAFNKDSLNAYIKKMSFDEGSGFSLNKLTLNVIANQDSAFINDFEIKLPQSSLKIGRANIALTQIDSLPQLLNNAPIALNINPSQICLKDLSPFVPAFSNFSDTIELSAEATGYINNIDLKQLMLKYSEKMLFVGKMELKGITKPAETYLFGQVNKLYITTEGLSGLLNNFNKRTVQLPLPVRKLGTINFTGEISGFFDNLVAFGKLSSAIGSVQMDMIFGNNKEKNIAAYLKGHITTSDIQISELLKEGNPYGKVRLDVSLDAHRRTGDSFAGKIEANVNEFDFKGYHYENILLSGNFKKNSFDGMIHIDDPNAKLHAEGMFEHQGKNSVFKFTANLNHFRPDSLHLTNKYEAPDISLSLDADFTGDNIDNVEGSVTVDSLSFKTAPSSFFLKQLQIIATGHSLDRHLTIASDVLNGEVTGAYSFTTLIPSLIHTFRDYLPALTNATQKPHEVKENDFALLLTIENSEALSETLKLPFTMLSSGRITGHYNNRYNKFRVEAFLPKFKIGKSMFESGYLAADNPDDKVELELRATNYNLKGTRNYVDLKVDAKENQINSLISWANNKTHLYKADLSASTRFVIEKGEKDLLRTEISLHESPLVINDSLWLVKPASITLRKGKIGIDKFSVVHDNQYLHLNGVVSKEPTDTLQMDLKEIELSYIFDILNIPALQFGGKATGTFNIIDLYSSRMLNTDLEIENFSFNQVNLGRLNLFSEWDNEQKGIMLLVSIYKNDSTWTDVNGYIYPVGKKAGLSLYFDANDINVAFLHPFVESVIKGLQGRVFGNVHLYGPFSELTVDGDAFIKDGGLGIDFLDTYYTFSDSIHLTPASILFKNITINDKFGNHANVNLTFNHKHFSDFDFQVAIQAKNMLMFDASQKHNPQIFGTVYGTGSARIKGNEQLIDFNINMRSAPKTAINLNFMNQSKATAYDFITFVNKRQIAQAQRDTLQKDSIPTPLLTLEDDDTELRMNFLLDITPDANIELIMDPISGDKIKGTGNGSIQIQYGTKSDLRMYGGFDIQNGNYNFSLQQIIRKDFKIREGSTINFRGDPTDANLNIDAIYNLTANLGDLDQALLQESARTNVPVNCVLKLDGMLRNPAISFDLELPGSNEELERQMRSLVNTEDMMTRQIVYLLVLNKFYTQQNATSITNGKQSSEFSAVASSAISSQLSSILNSFTDKVQLGTNIRTGQNGFTDTEMEMMLSSQLLDNRLLINGNFGYKNNPEQRNAFIGEFDLEYKLTKTGDIRLKAFNHANDMYRVLKSSLTRQGVGIMFKKDFTRPSEIFRRKRLFFLPPAKAKATINQKDSIPTTK